MFLNLALNIQENSSLLKSSISKLSLFVKLDIFFVKIHTFAALISCIMNYDLKTKTLLLEHLLTFVSEERKQRFLEIIKQRTRHVTVVIEDIYQSHNASAVLRSCDLTGIQDVHIIENKNEYEVNPEVSLGSSKWLNIVKYNQKENNTLDAYTALRNQGYRIVATTPHKKSKDLDSLCLDNKVAIVFGTELTGLSEEAITYADDYLRIPMYGFTESYNISVSAALSVFTLSQRLRKSNINWDLREDEIIDILLGWARNSIKRYETMENHFINNLM